MEKIKNRNGITMMAIVISTIIMLILATVTITSGYYIYQKKQENIREYAKIEIERMLGYIYDRFDDESFKNYCAEKKIAILHKVNGEEVYDIEGLEKAYLMLKGETVKSTFPRGYVYPKKLKGKEKTVVFR